MAEPAKFSLSQSIHTFQNPWTKRHAPEAPKSSSEGFGGGTNPHTFGAKLSPLGEDVGGTSHILNAASRSARKGHAGSLGGGAAPGGSPILGLDDMGDSGKSSLKLPHVRKPGAKDSDGEGGRGGRGSGTTINNYGHMNYGQGSSGGSNINTGTLYGNQTQTSNQAPGASRGAASSRSRTIRVAGVPEAEPRHASATQLGSDPGIPTLEGRVIPPASRRAGLSSPPAAAGLGHVIHPAVTGNMAINRDHPLTAGIQRQAIGAAPARAGSPIAMGNERVNGAFPMPGAQAPKEKLTVSAANVERQRKTSAAKVPANVRSGPPVAKRTRKPAPDTAVQEPPAAAPKARTTKPRTSKVPSEAAPEPKPEAPKARVAPPPAAPVVARPTAKQPTQGALESPRSSIQFPGPRQKVPLGGREVSALGNALARERLARAPRAQTQFASPAVGHGRRKRTEEASINNQNAAALNERRIVGGYQVPTGADAEARRKAARAKLGIPDDVD